MGALGFACISSADLDTSIAFYRDVIGFDVAGEGSSGRLRAFLGVAAGPPVRWALMRACGLSIGQILLLQCPGETPEVIREPLDRTTRGLWNINFYVADLRATARDLRARGLALWSDPVEYPVGDAGSAVEVLFNAPDGVSINLVQPLGSNSTFTGRIRAAATAFGSTVAGFSPVATTACCVWSVEPVKRFFQKAFDLSVVLDEVLGREETNRFLCRPATAQSRTVFLEGEHFFGKIALNEPLNYDVPDRSGRARAGNIGYFAMGFRSQAIALDVERAVGARAEDISGVVELDIPELGSSSALLRAPGGPLIWMAGDGHG